MPWALVRQGPLTEERPALASRCRQVILTISIFDPSRTRSPCPTKMQNGSSTFVLVWVQSWRRQRSGKGRRALMRAITTGAWGLAAVPLQRGLGITARPNRVQCGHW